MSSFWRSLIQRMRGGETPQASGTLPSWGGIDWSEWSLAGNSSLPAMTESSARTLTAVHACIDRIAGAIAAMPLHLYRRTATGRERYMPDLWWLLNERPHPDWSGASMWRYAIDSRLLHGDAFIKIHRKPSKPDVLYFEPLDPTRVEVYVKPGVRWYIHRPLIASGAGMTAEAIHPDDILHIPGPGYNGIRSISTLRYGLLRSGAIALAADESSAQFYSDGIRPDFAIEVPGSMDPVKQDRLRQSFLDRHTGPGNKRAPVVLANGLKLHQLTMTMVDADLLKSRSFQVEEICRIFGVPPFMIGHTEKTSSWGTGVEQMGIGFVKYTLSPHLTAIEQELNHKLFATSRNFAEFVTAGLERGDLKGRNEAYRIGLGRAGEAAWLTVDEVRALENLPPLPDGAGAQATKAQPDKQQPQQGTA